jgi:hypothetical protein
MRSLGELDISKARCRSIAFVCRLRLAQTAEHVPSRLFTFREAGMHFSPVTTSRTTAPPCLPLYIKDLLKEDVRLFWGGFLL